MLGEYRRSNALGTLTKTKRMATPNRKVLQNLRLEKDMAGYRLRVSYGVGKAQLSE